MVIRLLKNLKWMVLTLLTITLLPTSEDVLHLNPAQEVAKPYIYDLVRWHIINVPSKWTHALNQRLPWNSLTVAEKQRQVQEYLALGNQTRILNKEMQQITSENSYDNRLKAMSLEDDLDEVKVGRNQIEDDVEATIEATISVVIKEIGLASWGNLVFPPVDIRLNKPPKLLITSPRDRILRTHDVLLEPGVKAKHWEEIEETLLREFNLSAIVTEIGGVATFPAILPNDQPLETILRTAAHEWLHHYFFFRPLGQNMFKSSNMQILNETVADIAGREIGDLALNKFGDQLNLLDSNLMVKVSNDEHTFDFGEEMRITRVRVDELLANGKIQEAESYMEERRKLFVEKEFLIRRLNQAYFAFHGTYAGNPASVSPIGAQLHLLRSSTPSLGSFIKTTSGVSSYEQFLETLEGLKTTGSTK